MEFQDCGGIESPLAATQPGSSGAEECPLPPLGSPDLRPAAHVSPPAAKQLLRVLHVVNGEFYSGAERVQDLLAARLPEFGFEVEFACLKPDRFPQSRQSRQTVLHALPMGARCDLRVVARLAWILARRKIRLVHAHTPRAALVARLATILWPVPLVYHVHSPAARETTEPWRNRWGSWAERIGLIGVRRLIAVSQSLATEMVGRGIPAQRTAVVHNGVPARPVLPLRNAPDDTWTLGTVALFRPRKGIEVFLEAVAMLHRQGQPLHVRAVGPFESKSYESHLKTLTHQLRIDKIVQWVGFCGDVTAELDRMDLFVLPSLFGEGLPMVVLEAMAAGVPVVATAVEGVAEAVRNETDGLVVRPGDPHDLARAIAEVISGRQSWQRLRSNAWRRQTEAFSDTSMAEGVAAVYQQVLGAKDNLYFDR